MTTPAAAHRSFAKHGPKQSARQLHHPGAAACPCGTDKTYGECCGLYHAGWHTGSLITPRLHAPTPEALMRSRYSAYALKLADYLLGTWHGSTAPGEIDFPPTKWLGLEIKHAETRGGAGVVEFIARYKGSTGRASRLHEVSRFVSDGMGLDARWLYIDGQVDDVPSPSQEAT